VTGAGRDAYGGGEPDRGGRREALDALLGLSLQDGARADEADAGGDALDHSRHVARPGTYLDRDQHKGRRRQRDRHMRAQAGGFAHPFTLNPNQAAEHGGAAEAPGHPHEVSGIREVEPREVHAADRFIPRATTGYSFGLFFRRCP
jgi:hypothetical protein